MWLLCLSALAKPPSPTLYAWVGETDAGGQLSLALTLGGSFDPALTYRIVLERQDTPAGQIRCRSTGDTLRCRIERAGEHCPDCSTVLDVPLDGEASAPGIRAFAGRRSAPEPTDTLVFAIDTAHLPGEGLLTAKATVERVAWLPEVKR